MHYSKTNLSQDRVMFRVTVDGRAVNYVYRRRSMVDSLVAQQGLCNCEFVQLNHPAYGLD